MVILDGIVMGPTHCAYIGCTSDLITARGGAFCPFHETQYGAQCHVHDCQLPKINPSQACQQHQPEWQKYLQSHSCENLSGVRCMLKRPGETLPWQSNVNIQRNVHNLMIKMHLNLFRRITLVQTIFIVLKQFVLLVVQ